MVYDFICSIRASCSDEASLSLSFRGVTAVAAYSPTAEALLDRAIAPAWTGKSALYVLRDRLNYRQDSAKGGGENVRRRT